MYATISADIVSSTSLSVQETVSLRKAIKRLFRLLKERFPDFRGRQVKGDYIECLIPNAADSMRVALLIKSFVKSFRLDRGAGKREFITYGLRMAIGIGGMRRLDGKSGVWDGEAIYLSGRALENMDSLKRGTLTIAIGNEKLSSPLRAVALLTDAIMNNATQRQSEVSFYKLLGYKEDEIAQKIGVTQSAVNSRSSAAKWYCLEEALRYFESINFEDHE